jgi:replicative DNA helicase
VQQLQLLILTINREANELMPDHAEAKLLATLNAIDAPKGQQLNPRPARRARPPRLDVELPHSDQAEKGVLSAILQDSRTVLSQCQKRIAAEHFANPIHRLIYESMLELNAANEPIDFITLPQVLRDRGILDAVGGIGFIADLQVFGAVPAAIKYYLDILVEKHA